MTVAQTNRIKIAASILAADFADLGGAVSEAEAGGADVIHIDMMDGHYVRNITFGFDLIPALRKRTALPLVPHLELSNPGDLLETLAERGSDMIVVQEDTCPDLGQTIERLRALGVKVGVGVNPDRSPAPLREFLPLLDLVIVMSVAPGFGGQSFDPAALPKLVEVREWRDSAGLKFEIGIDGGVNEQTIRRVVEAGADHLIIGSAIFQRDRVGPAIARMRALIASAG
jgi:ribulose-phosphate 3-epimerase